MRVGIRVDSSDLIGIGHLNRSITLANEFKKAGNKVFFFTSNLKGNRDKLIKQNGFNSIKMNKNEINQNDFKKKFLIKDAIKIVKQIQKKKLDLFIIDNYLINEKWEKIVSKHCKIALIEDYLQRKTYCNYLISYHLSQIRNISKLIQNKNCLRLTDPQYTIIKKKENFNKTKNNYNNKILIYMGGADNKNISIKLAKIFSDKIYNKLQFSLLTNKGKSNRINKIIGYKKNFHKIIKKQKNLYSLARKHKYIISNMGLSMYEFAHFASNIVLIPQSSIHHKISKGLKDFKIFKIISSPKKKHFKNDFSNLRENKKTINERATIYDGAGAKRLVDFFCKKFYKFKLIKSKTSDKYFLYNLVNDPLVRSSSINTKIIKFNNHMRWYKKIKEDKKIKSEIFYSKNLKIGQVRLEKKLKIYNLDYSISNEFRKMGFGYEMIKLTIKKFKLKKLRAFIKSNNLASINTLEKVGFKKISQRNGVLNYLYSI